MDQQQAFIRTMQEKYGPQFDAEFETQVKNKFCLNTHGVEYACHAQKFAGSAHLDKLLARPKNADPGTIAQHSLFSPSSSLLTTEELKEVAQMIKRLEETPMLPDERIESRDNIIGALQYLVDKSAEHQRVSETIGHITTTCPALYDELYKDTAVLLDRLAKNYLDVPQEPKP